MMLTPSNAFRALIGATAFIATAFSGEAAVTANELPVAWPALRYEKMMGRSPFALATPVAPPTAPNFAANLYATGLAKVDDKDFVSISSRDLQTKFSLLSGETSPDGISVVAVQWSEEVGKSKITIKKGAETAVIGFDEMAMKSSSAGAPGGPQPPQIPQIPRPGQPNFQPAQPAPYAQFPRPVQQPYAQRPQSAPTIGQPPSGQASDGRRRIRIINSKP